MLDIVRQAQPHPLILYHQPGAGTEGVAYLRRHYAGAVVLARDLDVF